MADPQDKQAAVRAYILSEDVDPKLQEFIIDLLQKYPDVAFRTAIEVFLKYRNAPSNETQKSLAHRALRVIFDALDDVLDAQAEREEKDKFAELIREHIRELTDITTATDDYLIFLMSLADVVSETSADEMAAQRAIDVNQAVNDALLNNYLPYADRRNNIQYNRLKTAQYFLRYPYLSDRKHESDDD